MRIIPADVSLIEQMPALQHIERCGRVCYKSEGKIEEGSAEQFVSKLIEKGHESVLEHGHFCFSTTELYYNVLRNADSEFEQDVFTDDFGYRTFLRYSNFNGNYIISGNARAWRTFFKAFTTKYRDLPACTKLFVSNYPALFPEIQKYALGVCCNSMKMVEGCCLLP